LGANLIMPILAEVFSWSASLTFLAALSLGTGGLYLSLRKREAKTVHLSADA
jgi:OPA family glycerol-3-phosphate transporter-like MFS transporter